MLLYIYNATTTCYYIYNATTTCYYIYNATTTCYYINGFTKHYVFCVFMSLHKKTVC